DAPQKQARVILRLTAYIILFCSFLVYPPNAYFFLVFTVWKTTCLDNVKGARSQIYEEISMVTLLSVAYFCYAKFLNPFVVRYALGVNAGLPPGGPYQIALASDLGSRVSVARDYFDLAFSLWPVGYSRAFLFVLPPLLILWL